MLRSQNCHSCIIFGNSSPFGIKRIDNELTQSRVFLFVNPSPRNSCPKCAPQFAHSISVLIPSGSGIRLTAFGKLSSKLGHPHPASNLLLDENRGALHLLQINVPSSLKLSYSPVKGASVALSTITLFCSGVSLL